MAGHKQEPQVLINLSEAVPWWRTFDLTYVWCCVVGNGDAPCHQDNVYSEVHLPDDAVVRSMLVPRTWVDKSKGGCDVVRARKWVWGGTMLHRSTSPSPVDHSSLGL